MIRPPRLHPGDTIGIVCPSRWLKSSIFSETVDIFKARGYKIKLGASTKLKLNQYAGSPEQRAHDLETMFADPEVNAIICARGGYGANRVLPLLNYQIIAQHPKIFVGYSDITAYLTSITQRTGLVTFHGPMLITFKAGPIDYNFEYLEKTLFGEIPLIIKPPSALPAKVLKPGLAEGPLWGGNLTLIMDRLATEDQLIATDSILFLEDVHEYLYGFDRLLYHLRQTGTLDGIKGLIIGEMTDMKDNKVPFGKTVDEIVMDVCGDLNIPIISNFPCGHGKYQVTLPLSIPVRLNAAQAIPTLELLAVPVQ